jgi:hypothetical protein
MDYVNSDSMSKNRLIVLVPEGVAGSPELAKKIYWMAQRDQSDVFYLVFFDDASERLTISRSMATMKAMTTHKNVLVSLKNITGREIRSSVTRSSLFGPVS